VTLLESINQSGLRGIDMTWDGWSRIPNGVTYDAPAAITYDGVMYAYVRGTDNKVYVNKFNG
jgi:hypothetical protein